MRTKKFKPELMGLCVLLSIAQRARSAFLTWSSLDPGTAQTPIPTESLIAFRTFRDGNREIYVMNVDGSNPRNVTKNAANDNDPVWSMLSDICR
ncbi:MAG: hypothetical protein GDA56_17655 [Hormoscilla sp. GM7CHS1pb]|nr:hypothetical protein [Hormoscilla sp. GM7CHS1pb]